MTFQGIQGGDLVKYLDRSGKVKSGKANCLLLFPKHVVINVGGKHGTPQVVSAGNYVSHSACEYRDLEPV